MKKSSRVISTLLLGATLTTFSTGVFAVESQKVVKEKLAGASRYETNLAVSAKWEKAETVILVQGYAIPDALAATPLAKQKDAPILLTETNKLTKATADEITRLGAKNAIIVGGEGVVSKEVEKDLEAMKLNVTRLGGDSRYETSAAVVKAMGEVSKVAVVNGYGESDALSIAAPAAREGMAIVLAGKEELKGSEDVVKNAKEKYVIGGTGVVSEKLEKEIGAKRLGGENRNETNAAILNNFYNEKEIANLYVAKDGDPETDQLVDALGVGPLAGKEGNPVMLAGSKASAGQIAYLKDKTAKKVTEIGGGINQSTLADIVKALEVKDVTPEPGDKDKAEVTGVEVLNANQIKVNFSQKVDKDSAETIGNYTIKDDNGTDIKETFKKDIQTGLKVNVLEDEKTAVITLNQKYQENGFKNQETIRVKVENVMTYNKSDVFPKYENKNVRMFDNTLPELKSIKQVGPKDFDLVFSEPVTAKDTAAIVSAIRIDDGKYTCTAKTKVDDEKIAENVIRIKTPSEVKEGEHDLSIKENKIMDYAGLKLEEVNTKFEAKKNTEDLTASVYKTSSDKVTLQFNKEVENAETEGKDKNTNVSYYLDYENENGYKATSAIMKDGKLEIVFPNEISSGDHKILVVYGSEKKDKVQDLWENELATKEIAFTIAKDTIAPTATASYNKKDKTIEIKYSKKVVPSEAKASANYELKDSKGNIKSIGKIEPKDGNSLVYTINAEKLGLSGKYTLKIKGNKIHDTSVEKNAVKEIIFDDLEAIDSTPALVTSVRYGGEKENNKVYVEFSEDMRTGKEEGSIEDMSLYNLHYTDNKGKPIDKNLDEIEDAKLEKRGNNAIVITLPDATTNAPIVKVGRVCDANGNFAKMEGTLASQVVNAKKVNGNQFTAVIDSEIEVISGAKLDENDILEKAEDANVNKTDTNTIEMYVKGEVTVAVDTLVKVDGIAVKKIDTDLVNLKVTEGEYVKATKLTIELKDDIKTNPKNIVFEGNALTTMLETKSTKTEQIGLVFSAKSNKLVADYVDDSASIYTKTEKDDDGNVIKEYATEIEFKLTEPIKSVTKHTFEVEGYKIESADFRLNADGKNKDRSIVVLKVNQDNTCVADKDSRKVDIDVKQIDSVYNDQDVKSDGMSFQIEKINTEENLKAVTSKNEEEVIKALKAMNIDLSVKDFKDSEAEVVTEYMKNDNNIGLKTRIEIEDAIVAAKETVRAAKVEAIEVAKYADAKDANAIKTLLDAETNALGLDVTKYKALTKDEQKTAVADTLFKDKANLTSKTVIQGKLDEAVKAEVDKVAAEAEKAEVAKYADAKDVNAIKTLLDAGTNALGLDVTKYKALTKDEQKTAVADTLFKDKANLTSKTVIQGKLDGAVKAEVDKVAAEAAATLKVNDLFKDATVAVDSLQLKDSIEKNTIITAKNSVEALNNGDTKTTLNSKVQKAIALWNAANSGNEIN